MTRLVCASLLIIGTLPVAATAGDLFLIGADVSLLPKLEAAGVVYKDVGKPGDMIEMLKKRGANCIRLRLFVNPSGEHSVVNDLPYTIRLARRVKQSGMLLLLDLHYSDTWADPGHQTTPAAWRTLSFPQLVDKVQTYTADVVTAFAQAHATPDMLQIGNEITNGMLWPNARFDHQAVGSQELNFDRLAELLRAGARGVRSADTGKTPIKIMLHVSRGADPGLPQWFFDHITARNVPFDMIGLSFYPFMGDKLSNLHTNLLDCAGRYGKPVIVVETAYPWQQINSKISSDLFGGYPQTPQGQKHFLGDLIAMARTVPGQSGVIYWCPEFVPVEGSGLDGWWNGKLSLFDNRANALPALEAFRRGIN